MSRPSWLKNAIAKNDGYYSPRGEKLKAARLTDAQVNAFNGKKEAPVKEEPKAEPVVETTVVVEEAEQEVVEEETVTLELETAPEVVEEEAPVVEEAPKKKSSRRRKKK